MNMNTKIFEDRYDQEFEKIRDDLMNEEEKKRVDFYIKEYEELKADMEERATAWEVIEKAYKGEREIEYDGQSEALVNVILPNIEGQVSSMMNHKISASFRGKGYSDQKFARTADIIMRTVFKENKIKQKVKRSGRRYLTFGNGFMSVSWDPDMLGGFGLPSIDTPSMTKIHIDPKIKNIENVQRAEYIIEEIPQSILWARKEFGDDIANAIRLGNETTNLSNQDRETNDEKNFTYLRIWTRNNEDENLQLIELSQCGLLLRESDPSKPYYKYVHNKYPIFMTGLYPIEDELYRFGDGKVLLPLQKMINELYDEILIAVRFASQGRTYVDPKSRLNPHEFEEANPRKPLYVNNPGAHIKTEQGQGINPVVFNLLEQLFQKVQESTRFSTLMTGNDGGQDMTATQAGIMMQQGVTGIDDKRGDISSMLQDAVEYALGLCMEFWPTAKALRIAEDQDEFEWVDARQLGKVPEMIPASNEYLEAWREDNPGEDRKNAPEFMQLQIGDDETGMKKPATKQVELDIEVSIGEGLPTNKASLYNIILQLAQMRLFDEKTQMERPLLSFEQTRQMAEDILGIKIDDALDQDGELDPMMLQQLMMGQGMPMGGQAMDPRQQPLNMDMNIPGANSQGQMKGGPMNGI